MALSKQKTQESGNIAPARDGEQGYLLLGAVVAVALVMIALSVAAVKVSFALKREREEESVRRAQQYVRAIREYYLKFGRYPGSVEQLENTNTIRFLRKKYVDPLTGKADYRLVIVGQNKTTPKGFFGEPLTGLPGSGPGAGGGIGSPTAAGAGGAANGIAGGIGAGGGNGNIGTMGFGGTGAAAGVQAGLQTTGAGATAQSAAGATGGSSSSPTGSSAGSSGPGSNIGPIMGVGSSATGNSVITVNEQTSYDTWEFLYDPREERLRQQGQLNSGVGTAGGSGGLPGTQPAAGTPGVGAAPQGVPAPGAGVAQPTQP